MALKLEYETFDSQVLACVIASQLKKVNLIRDQKPNSQELTLFTELADYTSKKIVIQKVLPIVNFLLWKQDYYQDALKGELAFWSQTLLQEVSQIHTKEQLKKQQSYLQQLDYLEQTIQRVKLQSDDISSVLIWSFIHQNVMENQSWYSKKFPNIFTWVRSLFLENASYNTVKCLQENLPESYKAEIFKQANELTQKRQEKKVQFYESNSRLQRINRTEKVPQENKKNVLITSALPYVNNVPHLGNIIGCVLSADTFARYSRQRGYNTLYICGTDEYGTATEVKAIEEKLTPKEICDKYHEIHKKIYEWFDCDFDYFGRTSTNEQTQITQDIFKRIQENKLTYEEEMNLPYCSSCNRWLADRYVIGNCPSCNFDKARGDQCDSCSKLLNPVDLINSKCIICQTTPQIRQSKHIFINLPSIKERLVSWHSGVIQNWSNNSQQMTFSYVKDLRARCITRDLVWGTPVPLEEYSNKVFYVWFDAPIGYISITANYTKEWKAWWQNKNVKLFQFMGKDNVPFHTTIFPSTLLATGESWTLLDTLSTTEYLNYMDGKFSKSRGTGVFGDDAMNLGLSPELFRFYLLLNRPEQSDSMFTWKDFQAHINNEFLPNIGNFVNRVLKFSFKYPPAFGNPQQVEIAESEQMFKKVTEYCENMEQCHLKQGLKIAIELSSMGNKFLQDQKVWTMNKTDMERCKNLVFFALNYLRLITLLLEPFVPSFCAKVYEQMSLERTPRDEVLLEEILLKGASSLVTLIPKDFAMKNDPAPIVRTSKFFQYFSYQ